MVGYDKEQRESGYEQIIDPATGSVAWQVERATGEVYENRSINVPVGTVFITPEQQRIRTGKAKHSYKRRSKNPKFYFASTETEAGLIDLAPVTVTRLVYLAAFLPYGKSRLMETERTAIKRRDLPRILDVSKATVSRFWGEVCTIQSEKCNTPNMKV